MAMGRFSIFLCGFLLVAQTVAAAVIEPSNESNRNLRRGRRQSKKRRQQPNQQQITPQQQSTVKIQTKPCLLFFVARDNVEKDQFQWRCKMKGQDATNAGAMIGGLHAYVDIQGIEYVLAANPGIISGETLLFAEGAVIEDHLLVISTQNELKFDSFRHSTIGRSGGRRKLATTTGNKNVLVARVIATDASPTATAAEISDSIFGTNGDPVNLKSQYEGCSSDKITITPATGTGTACLDDPNYTGFFQFAGGSYADCDWFTFYQADDPTTCATYGDRADLGGGSETGNNSCCACGAGTTSTYNKNVVDGVFEVSVPVAASSVTSNQLEEAALNELEAQFQMSNLESNFDLIMLCLPPGTTDGNWIAYAGLPGYVSVYNNNACLYPSVQTHEIGHNIGLTHSSDVTDGNVEYGDRSGMMGISYFVDDGPAGAKMCFNPAKSYALGWYSDKNVDVDTATASFCGNIVGVANYATIAGDEKVVLKIPDTSVDYYVGYNHAVGVHEGTNEAVNQVTVVSQDPTFGSFSYLEARLSAGGQYTISNILGSGEDVTIEVVSTDSSASGFAEVQVYRGAASGCEPSAQPSLSPSGLPSSQPSIMPSSIPSVNPSGMPSRQPSIMPSSKPSIMPSSAPSTLPSIEPSQSPSIDPSQLPSSNPSLSGAPSLSNAPSSIVAPVATVTISANPSQQPSSSPSLAPSRFLSTSPSIMPSQEPSLMLISMPSNTPSIGPSQSPSIMPSQPPSPVVSNAPSTSPSLAPSIAPSAATNGQDQWNCFFNEDFENGLGFMSGRRGCVSVTNRGGSNGSQNSLRLAGRYGVTSNTNNSYDVSQYSRIRVSFTFRTASLPTRAGFYLDIQVNGGRWSRWQRFAQDSFCSSDPSLWCSGEADYELTGGINMVKFRFRTWRTRRYKTVYIDDVKFEAYGPPSLTVNGVCPTGPSTQSNPEPSSKTSSRRSHHRRRRKRRKNPKKWYRNNYFQN